MAEILCDSESFTITIAEAPDLAIIAFTPPTSAEPGDEISVSVTIKNNGDVGCKYKVKLIDVDGSDQGLCGTSVAGEVIDEEPNTYLIGDTINPGETKTKEVNTNGWCGAMPNNAWNLRVEAWRQT